MDYNGIINFRVTCKLCKDDPNTSEDESIDLSQTPVIIRPIRKGISTTIDNVNKIITFSLDFNIHGQSYLSFEIGGHRYRNVHIFANEPAPAPPLPGEYTTVEHMHNNLVAIPPNGGDGYTKLVYVASSNEHIYIGGDEVFNGGIKIVNATNVKISGRGVIEQSNIPIGPSHTLKNYSGSVPRYYNQLRGITASLSDTITVDGIIISDPSQNTTQFNRSTHIRIRNLKTFSRVIWGAAIYLERVDDVVIENSFLRSSDDAIPIYAGTHHPWGAFYEGDTWDVTVKNTSLYADKAHAILIGREGDTIFNVQEVRDVLFENVDVLEHEQKIEENGSLIYSGAIAVKSGEFVKSRKIKFKNVNVEDFSRGSLFSIIVDEPHPGFHEVTDDGYKTLDIEFDNLNYYPSAFQQNGDVYDSEIKGLSKCLYVNGVSFNSFKIHEGQTITTVNNPTDFDDLVIGDNAYDITFNENPVLQTGMSGLYDIKVTWTPPNGQETTRYLNPSQESLGSDLDVRHARLSPWTSKWELLEIPGTNEFRIKSNYNQHYLTLIDDPDNDLMFNNSCHGEYVVTTPLDNNNIRQRWKFIDLGEPNGRVRIVNAQQEESLSLVRSSITTNSDISSTYALAYPWGAWNIQRWYLIPDSTSEEGLGQNIAPVPNTADQFFELDLRAGAVADYTIKVYDMFSNLHVDVRATDEVKRIDTSNLANGLYVLHISDGQQVQTKMLAVKH